MVGGLFGGSEEMNIMQDDSFKDMMQYDILGGYSQMKKRPYTEEEKQERFKKMYNLDDNAIVKISDEYRDFMDSNCFIIEDEIAHKTKKFEDERILSNDDKELLIEYAPKLFSTWPDHRTIQQTMFNFVDKVYQYRYISSSNYIHNSLNAELSQKYLNDHKGKIKSLSTHLQEALDLMSRKLDILGGRVGTTIEDHFQEKLPAHLIRAGSSGDTVGNLVVGVISEIIQNPEKYIMKKIDVPGTKMRNDIKKYLISLKLEGKSEEINNFIKELI